MRRYQKIWIAIFLAPSIILFLMIYLYPILTVIISSFTKWNGMGKMVYAGLSNYKELFLIDGDFKQALINTLIWAVLQGFVHVPIGVTVALVLAKKPFGWRLARTSFIFPNIISASAWALIYMFIFNPGAGLLNGFIRFLGFKDFTINWFFDPRTAFFAVTCTWLFYAAVITLITMAELSSISPSIYEAARIDGASPLQIDLLINLPLLKNVIGTGMIIAITSMFGNFNLIYMTTRGGPGNLTTNLPLLVFDNFSTLFRFGYANAIGTVLLVLGVLSISMVTFFMKMNSSAQE
ncbi:MAG: carbohydrate ABC transporter permease [Bacillota bacterium]